MSWLKPSMVWPSMASIWLILFNLSCFFFFFWIIGLYFLIPAVFTQIFHPTAELIMPIGIQAQGAKTENETYPVTAETKLSKYSI